MVISQMEVQLDRVKLKRKERMDQEYEASRIMGGKAKEIMAGERKKERLKREIEAMWSELEGTFNNNAVTELENDLKAQKVKLLEIFQDTQG